MTFNHVGAERVNEILSKVVETGRAVELDQETIKDFYSTRMNYLNKQVAELEDKEKELQQVIEKEVKHICATKGAELLSIKQLLEVMLKELGACECKLSELNEQNN